MKKLALVKRGPSPIQKLATQIAKREGKKSQAKIGDIREILNILMDIQVEYLEADQGYATSPIAILHEEVMKRLKWPRKT